MKGDVGFRGELKARKIRDPRARRLFIARLPRGLGKIAYTRDPGEARMFSTQLFSTRLMAHVYAADGRHIAAHDLGAGKVTDVGVLAMANDFRYAQVSGAPVNTLGACKFHAWGIGTGAEANTSVELGTYSKPTAATENAVEGVNSLGYIKSGINQKLKSIATITAAENLAITEWGLHSTALLKPANSTAVATSATTLETTAAGFTASGATTRGEQNKVVLATEAAEVYGLIYESTTKILTVPGWLKIGSEAEGATPNATTKFRVIPTLWDRRKFEPLNVENTNKIEFIYELEIKAGG